MSFSVTIHREFSDEDIRCLLCCALEGGSNYWYTNARIELAAGLTQDDFKEGGKHWDEGDWSIYYLAPFVEGCVLLIDDASEDRTITYRINRETMQCGLTLMSDPAVCPSFHMENLCNDNADAETGDVWLQLCCFGEVLYS